MFRVAFGRSVGLSSCQSIFTRSQCSAAALFQSMQSNSEEPAFLRQDPIFQTRSEGELGDKDYKVFIIQSSQGMMDMHRASPYFAIPLYSKEEEEYMHMVCEIPRGTTEKMEVCFNDKEHAIKQDLTSEGKLRHYRHGAMPWNYGMLPQTYSDPKIPCEKTNVYGDGDPLDIIEIGSSTLCTGEVVKFKPLAAIPMVDEGEMDWKIVGINAKDDLAPHLNGISDINDTLPGVLDNIKEWFRIYKVAEGKAECTFALDGVIQDRDVAEQIIAEGHERLFGLLPRMYEEDEKRRLEEEGSATKTRRRRKPTPRAPLDPYQ